MLAVQLTPAVESPTHREKRSPSAFACVVSYESDTEPVETLRFDLSARDTRQAALRGGREASRRWPKGRKFRSVVVVVERVSGDVEAR